MRKKVAILFLLVTWLCLALSPAQAYLFDTGIPTRADGISLNSSQSQVAGQFTLTTGWHVTSLECYVDNNDVPGQGNMNMVARIYADNSGVPGTVVAEPSFYVAMDSGPGWYGANSLDVTLSAGTYWFGVAWTGGNEGQAYIEPPNSPNAFSATAYYDSIWHSGADIGYRIDGNPVPIPPAAWLLGSGLLGLLGFRRMKQG